MKIGQDEREIEICLDAVKQLKPTAILEIGSNTGGSLAVWLKSGARHVVSIDVDHSLLDWDGLNAARSGEQKIHLITGSSRDPAIIAKLDQKMKELSIAQFDVAFIDGAHDYTSVKSDFATCLPRTSKLLIFNDPVMVDVGEFIAELARVKNPWRTVNVVNPNRRLPCAGEHTCGSDYLVETGGGNYMVFLTPETDRVFSRTKARVEKELVPEDPEFRPHRAYFHQRGLAQSPAYAAYWQGMYPKWAFRGSWLFATSASLYRLSHEHQMKGRIEESHFLIRKAKAARRRWLYYLLRRMASRILKLVTFGRWRHAGPTTKAAT